MIIIISPDPTRYEARDHNRWSCPIATALANKLRKTSVCVTETTIRLVKRTRDVNGVSINDTVIWTPEEMYKWIREYDMGLSVPTDIKFELDVPEEYIA